MPGAFRDPNYLILQILKHHHNPNQFIFYDGVDNSIWNGGKPNILSKSTYSYKTLKKLNSMGIGVYLTYSNFFIEDINLSHENQILEQLNESDLNGVILVSDLLYNHIKSNYKNLKTALSVSSFKTWNHNDYNFTELEDKYDYICPMYTWSFDETFIKKINPSKYKIMLNDTCKVNCKNWHNHFVEICKTNLNPSITPEEADKIYQCWIATETNNPNNGWKEDRERLGMGVGMDITKDGIKKLQELGYTHFKVQGRDMPKLEFSRTITEYLKYFKN